MYNNYIMIFIQNKKAKFYFHLKTLLFKGKLKNLTKQIGLNLD